jgi:hypothetical protein
MAEGKASINFRSTNYNPRNEQQPYFKRERYGGRENDHYMSDRENRNHYAQREPQGRFDNRKGEYKRFSPKGGEFRKSSYAPRNDGRNFKPNYERRERNFSPDYKKRQYN